MNYKQEVGLRLREFAEKEKGSIAELARQLKMQPESLYDYLNGETIPGDRLQKKLEKVGCNVIWLLTGIYPNEDRQKKEIQKEIEQRKIITYLDSKGLDTLEKVTGVIEAYEPMLKVAEKMGEYKKNRKEK
jgi:transcriptional regulator with XRE-family HTH domain